MSAAHAVRPGIWRLSERPDRVGCAPAMLSVFARPQEGALPTLHARHLEDISPLVGNFVIAAAEEFDKADAVTDGIR